MSKEGRMITILLADDDPDDRQLTRDAFAQNRLANELHTVEDGEELLEYLRRRGKYENLKNKPLPGLILLDLKLPFVMGLDVLKWIRDQPNLVPVVIILTASAEDEDIASAYHLGANAFLTKPSEASKLQDIVKAIKDFWLTHNSLPRQSFEQQATTRWSEACVDRNGFPSSHADCGDWHRTIPL